MKLILFLFLVFASGKTNAQTLKDTLLINHNANQIIFIDTPHSKFHNLVFSILLSEIKQYDTNKLNLDKPDKLNSSYVGEWITVKQFKGKHFAYFPSEPFYNTFYKLSDSELLINNFNEGFISYVIDKKKERTKKMKLEIVGHDGLRYFMSIKQKTTTIFIVKSSLFTSNKLYFVKRQSYYDYPIIVNNCPTNRCQEFNFK